MRKIVLSLGSNINRDNNIQFALEKLRGKYGEMKISPVYETKSMGFEGPSFYNLVVGFESDHALLKIRSCLRGIESFAGRIREKKAFDNRVLDIDVILYGQENLHPKFNIPRDEIEKYAYVLKPLSDLYPDAVHPVTGQRYQLMWKLFDDPRQLVERIDYLV